MGVKEWMKEKTIFLWYSSFGEKGGEKWLKFGITRELHNVWS